MICPYCRTDNIQGVELCESCGADLAGLDLPEAGDGLRGLLLTGRLDDLDLEPVVEAPPGTSVADAVRVLREARHGCVLVRDAGELVGIFTERDLLERVLLPGLDPESTTLAEVMSPNPATLPVSDPPAFAVHAMVARGFRHLPVERRDGAPSFVSVRDLLQVVHDAIAANGS